MNQGNPVTEPCASIHDDLKAYCDGELSWLRRLTVRRHLATCAACREEVQAMQMLHQGLHNGDGPETTLAPALRERILAQVADVPSLPIPRRSPRLWQYVTAASLAVNGLLLFLVFDHRSEMATPLPSAADTAMPAASTPLAGPVLLPKPSGQPPLRKTVQPMHQPKMSPAVPNLRTQSAVRKKELFTPSVTANNEVSENMTASHASNFSTTAAPPAASNNPSYAQQSQPLPHASYKAMRHPGDGDSSVASQALSAFHSPRLLAPPVKSEALRSATPPGAATPLAAPQSSAATPMPAIPPPAVAPPPPVPSAPPVPAQRVEGFGGGGFGGRGIGGNAGGFGGTAPKPSALGVDRDKPVALDPWPAVLSSPADTNAPTGKTNSPSQNVDTDWQIDDQGHVSDINIPATITATLSAAIRDEIRGNHYLPATKNGRPIAARMYHTFVISP